jgi:GntR family transcriptional repressor for pyruvate dehydrogenase complex
MSFDLHAIDRSKLYTSIVDQIVEGVRAGAFPPGKALPAERVLASRLGVSRSSVREAIRVLEHAGVLDVRTGSGTYVSESGVTNAAMLRAQAAMAGEHSPLDVISARRLLEPVTAELAAVYRTKRDIDGLREHIRKHGELVAAGADPEEVDYAFHIAVAAASQNSVMLSLVQNLAEMLRQAMWHDLKHQTLGQPGRAEHYLDQHRTVLLQIERFDSRAANQAMADHLRDVEAGLLDVLE